jgi:Na+/phosphate symporter
MDHQEHPRWAGLCLAVGVVLFSGAVIAAEPFEQATPQALYIAIAENAGLYLWLHILATIGMLLITGGFVVLVWSMDEARRTWGRAGLGLLGIAVSLWMVEIIARLTMTMATSQQVVGGASPPTAFPATIGIGFELLFRAFLLVALAGIATLIWTVGQGGLISRRLALIGVVVTITSGIIAMITYPWLGAVERALFYPLVTVVLPLAGWLLLRSRRPRLATST